MNIGFIIPSLTTLTRSWYNDLLWPMQGVPTLAGFLKRQGFGNIRQYDFDHQVLQEYYRNPRTINLLSYDDTAKVDAFLAGDEAAVRWQTETILDLLEVEEKDLYGISLASVVGTETEIYRGVRIGLCLAKVLKERFPQSTIVAGGLQLSPESLHVGIYEDMLRQCAALDYCGAGVGEPVLYYLLKAREQNVPVQNALPETMMFHPAGSGGVLAMLGDKNPYENPFNQDIEVKDPSIPPSTRLFDRANFDSYAFRGADLFRRYNLPEEDHPKLATCDDFPVLLLPTKFLMGCSFSCAFCGSARKPVSTQDVGEAMASLRFMSEEFECKNFIFFDTNLNVTYAYADAFLDALIKEDLDLRWAESFNLRFMDEALVDKMRRAGVVRAVVGVEYPTPRMLKYMRKGLKVEKARESLELLHQAGIWNHALLISGMPTETEEDLLEFERWIAETKDLVNAYSVSPFYLISDSPFGHNPDYYSLNIMGDPNRIQGSVVYTDREGQTWAQRQEQIRESTRRIREAIVQAKGYLKYTSGVTDLHLLLYLYRALGYDNQAEIVRLYEASRILHPHLRRGMEFLQEQFRGTTGLGGLLNSYGLRVIEEPSMNGEDVRFAFQRGHELVSCRLTPRDTHSYLKVQREDTITGDIFSLRWDIVERRSQGFANPLGAYLSRHPVLLNLAKERGWRVEAAAAGMEGSGAIEISENSGRAVLHLVPASSGVRAVLASHRFAFYYNQPEGSSQSLSPAMLQQIGKILLALAESAPPQALSAAPSLHPGIPTGPLMKRLAEEILKAAEEIGVPPPGVLASLPNSC